MRNISVIYATDERGGMIFNKRRVSRDKLVTKDIVDTVCGKIYISEYSRILFEEYPDRVTVCANPLLDAPDGAVCFVEFPPIVPYIKDISRITVYNWNRRYPFELCIDISPIQCGFRSVSVCEFVGNAHEKITKEIFER